MFTSRWARWAAMAVLAVCATGTAYSVHQAHEATKCVTRFLSAYSDATQARSGLATRQNQVNHDVIAGLGSAVKHRAALEKFDAVFDTYGRADAQIAAEREQTPLPAFPQRCSDVS